MDNLAFWILVFPLLLISVLYYLGFLTAGLGFISSAFKSRGIFGKSVLLLIGIGIISFPFLATKIQHIHADSNADQRQTRLNDLERTSLSGQMPRKFVTVGRFSTLDIDYIKTQYRIGQFSQAETERLAQAYRAYRKAEYCHSHSSGKMMSPKLQIPICRDLPRSIQAALNINEPVLFFAEGASTSHRISNTFVGNMYEIRLVSPSKDLLVDYYEDRTLERPVGITHPFSSGLKRDPKAERLSKKDFIKRAMTGVK